MKVLPTSLCLLAIGALLAGCLSVPPQRSGSEDYRPAFAYGADSRPASDGSLFLTSGNVGLFGDRRAHRVGDLVTVRLQESTTSSKSAETTINKSTDVEMSEPNILGSLVRGVAANAGIATSLSSSNDFTGGAESDQSNSLQGTISVVVAEVYPNGLMRVEGEKWLTLNQGDEYVRVSGLVRPEDISGDNSVSSLQLADARIAYGGRGATADSNRMGWLARFFLSPLLGY